MIKLKNTRQWIKLGPKHPHSPYLYFLLHPSNICSKFLVAEELLLKRVDKIRWFTQITLTPWINKLKMGRTESPISEAKIVIEEDVKAAAEVGTSQARLTLFWMLVNIASTIGIVFTNKAVFSDKSLIKMPLMFTAFHFICTSIVLWMSSKAGVFAAKPISIVAILPLCFAFCGNVVLTNLSLAYSSVTFYQLVRILMTPGTAILNYIFYSVKINNQSIFAIIVICTGIAITTYYEALVTTTSQKTTSIAGVIFALSGVTASSIYVIWIGTFAKKFSVSSMQLLLNQAPLSAILLLVASPFSDTFPESFAAIPTTTWGYIALSGSFAILINVSQFFIIHGTNALTSTIVGHVKACSIVLLGWAFGGAMGLMSVLGVLIAILGIFFYSAIQQGFCGASRFYTKPWFKIAVAALVLLFIGFTFGNTLNNYNPINVVENSIIPAQITNSIDSIKNVCTELTMEANIFCETNKIIDLKSVEGGRENFYTKIMASIRDPPLTKKSFSVASSETKLNVVLIELSPHLSERFHGTVRNIAHTYGGTDTAFTIIHSYAHAETVNYLRQGGEWKNVKLMQINGSFQISNYNIMLMSTWFWEQFPSKFVLITHTDVIIFRTIDEEMFQYDLVGAPWPHHPVPGDRRQVGNGGHTLRNVEAMLKITRAENPQVNFPEDVWMSARVENNRLADEKTAGRFSAEMYVHENQAPSAVHRLPTYDVMSHAGLWLTKFSREYCDALN